MGQKTHPIGFRLGTMHTWSTKWFSSSSYKEFLAEDINIRKFLNKKLKKMGLSRIEIERSAQRTKVTLYVSKPGLVIGRGGSGIDMLRQELAEIIKSQKLQLAVSEIKKPNLSAKIIADDVASQIERRVSEKRILSSLVEKVMEAGALGVKVAISGRISGQDIARTVFKTEGSVPLQKISADIDFATATAFTKYGTMGIKVWINRKVEKIEISKDATK